MSFLFFPSLSLFCVGAVSLSSLVRVANEIGLAGLHRAKALCLVSLGETTVALPSEGVGKDGRGGGGGSSRRRGQGKGFWGKGDGGLTVEKENSQQINTIITAVVKFHSGLFIKRLSPLSLLNPTLLRALNFEGGQPLAGRENRVGKEIAHTLLLTAIKAAEGFLTSRKISGRNRRILIRLAHSWSCDHRFCFHDHF